MYALLRFNLLNMKDLLKEIEEFLARVKPKDTATGFNNSAESIPFYEGAVQVYDMVRNYVESDQPKLQANKVVEIAKSISNIGKPQTSTSNFFFFDTDGERYKFFNRLSEDGFKTIRYESNYNWKVGNGIITVEYLEGDVYLKKQ